MREIITEKTFIRELCGRIAKAKWRVYIQFMAFEGNATGQEVASKLIAASRRGVDVRVIIDCFTDFSVSDRFAVWARKESRSTRRMIAAMEAGGIKVVRTRPLGPNNIFFLFRNHKKIVIIDNLAAIGGINISDHTMVWHDFMVFLDDRDAVRTLVDDFLATSVGHARPVAARGVFTNRELERAFDRLLSSARKEIVISSPYFIGVGILAKLRLVRPGVAVTMYTAKTNNMRALRLISPYILSMLVRRGVVVKFYTRFSHAKCLIIDGKTVLFGSSNFGTESFRCKDEVGMVVSDARFACELAGSVLGREETELFRPRHISRVRLFCSMILSYLGHVALLAYTALHFLVRQKTQPI
jgi:cardiolipin synthase A/B